MFGAQPGAFNYSNLIEFTVNRVVNSTVTRSLIGFRLHKLT